MSPRQIRVAPAIVVALGLFAITVTAQDQGAYGGGRIEIKDPAELIKAQAEPIFSGPQPGESLPSFQAIGLSGAIEGKEFDPVASAGDKLHLLIFGKEARTFGRFLGNLGRQLDMIERNSGRAWEMSFIVVNDDPNDVESKFEAVARSLPASLASGLSVDGAEGPPAYGLNRNMTATVIVANGGVVVHSLPYPQDGFYSDPYILGALASAMEVDHATLRKHIGDTPGDQATAAARQRAGAANLTPEQRAFRAELGRRVQSGEITREEAGRLFRESTERAPEEPRPMSQGEVLAELAAGRITVEEASATMDRIREQQINQRIGAQRDTLREKLIELMREGKIQRADIRTILEAAFPGRGR